MELGKVYKRLIKQKPDILKKYQSSVLKKDLDLADYCKKFHPDYYYTIINVLALLGERTAYYGHSEMLRLDKNRFYKLMGL